MADLGNIDTSMYGNIAPVKIPNILGMAQTFATTQGAFQENEMRRRTIAARQEFGKILQSTIGPDGQPDYEHAAVLMSMNPATAWAAPEFIQQMAQTKGMNLQNVQSKLQLAYTQQSAIARTAAALQAFGSNVTKDQEVAEIQKLVDQGVITPEMQLATLKNLPDSGPGLFQFNVTTARAAQEAAHTMEKIYGGRLQTNTGAGVNERIVGQEPGQAGGPEGGGPGQTVADIGVGQTPGEVNAPTPYYPGPGEINPATGEPYPAGTQLTGPKGAVFQQIRPAGAPPVGVNVPAGGGGRGMTPAPEVAHPGGGGMAQPSSSGGQGMGVTPSAVGSGAPAAPAIPRAPIAAGGPSGVPPITQQTGPTTAAGRDAAIAATAGNGPPAAAITSVPEYIGAQRGQYAINRAAVANSVADGTSQLLQMKAFLKEMGGPKGITTSALGPLRAQVGRFLKASGLFPDDVSDAVANGSVPGSQIAEKLGATNVFQTLHQLLGGQNRVTNLFIDQLHQVLPSIATDPKATVEIFKLFGQMYDVQRLELHMYDVLTKQYGVDPADVPAAWAQWLNGPAGVKAVDRIMTQTPALLQPEIEGVKGAGQ